MNLPRISVVIPSYNKSKFIGRTLDSIVNQNYLNLEVIIQDGASTDGTLEIIKRYARKYPKIIIWESKKDKGQSDAINKGLKKITGDILTFINADDIYEPYAFKEIAKAYQKNPNTLWFAGRGKVIDESGREISRLVTNYKNFLLSINYYPLLLVVNYLMQPSVFLTRKTYLKFGPFTGTKDFVMEYDYWLKLGKIKMPVIINRYLSKFRIGKDTKTKTMFKKLLEEDEKIVKKHTKNPFILFVHKLHNRLRVLTVRGFLLK